MVTICTTKMLSLKKVHKLNISKQIHCLFFFVLFFSDPADITRCSYEAIIQSSELCVMAEAEQRNTLAYCCKRKPDVCVGAKASAPVLTSERLAFWSCHCCCIQASISSSWLALSVTPCYDHRLTSSTQRVVFIVADTNRGWTASDHRHLVIMKVFYHEGWASSV